MTRSVRGLTDDVLTLVPRAASVRAYLREAVDQLAGADPGLTQLRLATQAVLGVGLSVGLAYAFVRLSGALELPPGAGPAAVVAAANHALLIVAMLISAMVAMLAAMTVNDPTIRGQVLSTLFLPIPMLAAMTVGIALGPYRLASLIWLVILLAAAAYVRRFGPRGVATGMMMFNGGFLGFFLHAEIGLSKIGWLAALLAIGVLASLVIRITVIRPDPVRALARMRRSWSARADRLLELTFDVLAAPDTKTRRRRSQRMGRQLVRLNECTLMIDAQLAESVPDSAGTAAQRLFDADLALSNIARFAGALADRCTDGPLLARARACVRAVIDGDPDAVRASAADLRAASCDDARLTVVAHRLAASAQGYTTARTELTAAVAGRDTERDYTPAVTLNQGWLPGSGTISTEASTTPGRGGALDRTTMPPYVRAAIQVAVAVTIAIVVGGLISQQRLYWAVLATFLAFTATTNSGEQARKALFRAGGTAIGIFVGALLVHLTGGRVWASLLIVLVSLFLGIYLIRVNYTFMAIGITVTLSQLYAQLDEFSWHLLLLRLDETLIGVAAVIVTVLVVVPLRPQRVLTVGVMLWFRSLSTLVSAALDRLLGSDVPPLRAKIRDLDAAYAALESTAAPLRQGTFGRNSTQLAEIRTVSAAARHYARTLAVGTERVQIPGNDALREAADQLRRSMAAIDGRISTGDHGTYTRSAALLEPVESGLPPGDAIVLRDVALLDGALARLATALGMTVVDHDTAPSAR